MKLVDANVLLYAVNRSGPNHRQARDWLDEALSGSEPVAFTWAVVLAFLRLTTNPAVFPEPLTTRDAIRVVEGWLAMPAALVLEPGVRHLSILAGLLSASGTAGNLVSDAHLAAVALEHDATIVSYDADFSRFAGLDWRRPS